MIRLLYNLLFPLGLLFFMPAYVLKMRRRGNYRRNFGQRFGFYSSEIEARLRPHSWTWIHAVSVGEVAVALKLAAKLRDLDPSSRCVLTTTTTTGYAVAEAQRSEWLEVMYNPLDFLPIVRRAYALIRPVRIVLIEAEVWPNLVAAARRRRIPIALVNARLSRRSERRFLRVRPLVAPTFGTLDLVCVQEPADVARWSSLGVRTDRIRHVGSIKYDPDSAAPPPAPLPDLVSSVGWDDGALVLLGGSTHAGEEELLAETYRRLRAQSPRLALIIAPRHVERVPEIRSRLEERGLHVVQRSALERVQDRVDCLLLDTTGELPSWYGAATVVFVGKSITAHGGQNPVEPILAGKPVIFGPHMENFAALAHSLVAHRAALQISDANALDTAVANLLRDSDERARMVDSATRVLAEHRGATERTAALLLQLQSTPVRQRGDG